MNQILQLIKGLLAFIITWLACLVASPIFLAIIGLKYIQDFSAQKKKVLDRSKVLYYVPATKDNNIHSAN
jgi:hypothetical protein